MSHLYGVFPTHGFPNDTFFPSTYSIGEVVLENSGCAVNNKVRFQDLSKKQILVHKIHNSPKLYIAFSSLLPVCLVFAGPCQGKGVFLMRDGVLFRDPASSGFSCDVSRESE